MAFIRKRGKFWWLYSYGKDGRKTADSLKTGSKDIALQMLKDFKQKEANKKHLYWLSYNYTLSSAYNFYKQNKQLSASSLRLCDYITRLVINWLGDQPLSRLTRDSYNLINRNIQAMDSAAKYGKKIKILSPNTRRIYMAHLISIFNFYVEQEWIEAHYLKRYKSVAKPVQVIPMEHIRQILDNTLTEDHRDIILFLLLTGRRVSEILYLRTDRIDLQNDEITFYIPKTKKEVILPIIQPVKDLLLRRNLSSEYLFKYREYNPIRLHWDRLNKKLGFHYTLHQLRKTCASYLLSSGVNIVYIKTYLTHSSLSVTETHYLKKANEIIKKEIESKADFGVVTKKKNVTNAVTNQCHYFVTKFGQTIPDLVKQTAKR